jgi:lysophospholipase L1-like esterase
MPPSRKERRGQHNIEQRIDKTVPLAAPPPAQLSYSIRWLGYPKLTMPVCNWLFMLIGLAGMSYATHVVAGMIHYKRAIMNKNTMLLTLLVAVVLSAALALLPLQLATKILAALLVISLALLFICIKNLAFFLNGVVNHAKNRRKTMFDALTAAPADIVMLGDSITHEGLWNEYFPQHNLRNRGIGGNTTQDVIERLPAIYALQPKRLFLLIGINDINVGAKPAQTFANYARILKNLRQQLPDLKIYVQSILPVAATWPMAGNVTVKQYNARIERLAAQADAVYIDLHRHFSDAQGNLQAELSNDGIHLTHAGYLLWCDIIGPVINGSAMHR